MLLRIAHMTHRSTHTASDLRCIGSQSMNFLRCISSDHRPSSLNWAGYCSLYARRREGDARGNCSGKPVLYERRNSARVTLLSLRALSKSGVFIMGIIPQDSQRINVCAQIRPCYTYPVKKPTRSRANDVPTFAIRPTFLGVENASPDAAICVVGIPFDLATSNRPGARFGPAAIRAASRMLVDGDHPQACLRRQAGAEPATLDVAD